jgi:hypothetical protein
MTTLWRGLSSNGAADKQPPSGVVGFTRWMGGRERSEQKPTSGCIRRPIYEVGGIYSFYIASAELTLVVKCGKGPPLRRVEPVSHLADPCRVPPLRWRGNKRVNGKFKYNPKKAAVKSQNTPAPKLDQQTCKSVRLQAYFFGLGVRVSGTTSTRIRLPASICICPPSASARS